MITERLIDFVAAVVSWVAGLLPDSFLDAGQVERVTTYVHGFVGGTADWRNWIPLTTIFTAGLLIFGSYAAAVVVSLSRMVLSNLSGGGGAR